MQVCRQEEWVGNVFRDTPFKKTFQFLLKPAHTHTHRSADNHYLCCVCTGQCVQGNTKVRLPACFPKCWSKHELFLMDTPSLLVDTPSSATADVHIHYTYIPILTCRRACVHIPSQTSTSWCGVACQLC